jgi:hypothetical protein
MAPLAERGNPSMSAFAPLSGRRVLGGLDHAGVKSPGEVPRSQGKAVRVKDLRKKAD